MPPGGVFVLMDALGYKGIWRKSSHERVLAKMREMRCNVLAAVETQRKESGHVTDLELKVEMFSDSVLIGVSSSDVGAEPRLRDNSPYLLLYAAAAAATVIGEGARNDPKLVYRGVMTWGRYEMEDRFVVGEPIDEAVQLERQAEAAVVWLAPPATSVLTTNRLDLDELGFVKWSVPLKGGAQLATAVVNPFHWLRGSEDGPARDQLERVILRYFDSPTLDVQVKKQNTERFLSIAKKSVEH